MRRHPLASRRRRVVGIILVGPLLATCVSAGPSPSSALPGTGVTITTAPGETLSFQPTEVSVQAGDPIALTFRNGSSLAHNLTFTVGLTSATRTIVEPGSSDQLLLAPQAPGTYRFVCTIHEGMAGSLVVESSGSAS